MADLTFRIRGLVAYSDGSNSPFEASIYRGILHNPFGSTSLASFQQLYADKAADVNAMLALFTGPTHTLTPLTASPDKTVTDFVMEVTGTYARNNNTWASFGVVYDMNGERKVQDPSNVYDEVIAGGGTFLNYIDQAFEVCTGTGRTAITT